MSKIIITSSDWPKMLRAGWLGESPSVADAGLLLQKSTDHAWSDCNMDFGDRSCEFSDYVSTPFGQIKVIGFVDYICIPEQEDLENLIYEEKWAELKHAAAVLEKYADEEQDGDALIAEIEQAIEEYNARG